MYLSSTVLLQGSVSQFLLIVVWQLQIHLSQNPVRREEDHPYKLVRTPVALIQNLQQLQLKQLQQLQHLIKLAGRNIFFLALWTGFIINAYIVLFLFLWFIIKFNFLHYRKRGFGSGRGKYLRDDPGRRQGSHPDQWAKNVNKRKRNSGQSYVTKEGKQVEERKMGPPCNERSCALKCFSRIGMDVLKPYFDEFWDSANHDRQVTYSSLFIQCNNINVMWSILSHIVKSAYLYIIRYYVIVI